MSGSDGELWQCTACKFTWLVPHEELKQEKKDDNTDSNDSTKSEKRTEQQQKRAGEKWSRNK